MGSFRFLSQNPIDSTDPSYICVTDKFFIQDVTNVSSNVIEVNIESGVEIDGNQIKNRANLIRRKLGFQNYGIRINVLGVEAMSKYNLDYLQAANGPTDVISMPELKFTAPLILKKDQMMALKQKKLGFICLCPSYIDKIWSSTNIDNNEKYEKLSDIGIGNYLKLHPHLTTQERTEAIMLHGILHLVGYNHDHPRRLKRMISKEQQLLESVFGDL